MNDIFKYIDNYASFQSVKSILQYGDVNRNKSPVISVIMPIYNNPKMFKEALQSVVNQDCDFDYEVIIVDNNPYDGNKSEELLFVEKMNRDNVIYYRNSENIGMYGNWNRGIELANSEYLTYCHNDDLLEPFALSRLNELKNKYGKRLIASEFNTINDSGVYLEKKNPDRRILMFKQKKDFLYTKFDIFLNSAGFGVGCLFNKKIMLELGGFNPEYYPSADYALFAKYIFKYGGVFNRIPTFCYRKSINESYSTYTKFVDRDRFFRYCMLNELKIPKQIGRKIISANYEYGLYTFALKWGSSDSCQGNIRKNSSYYIMKAINKINSIRRFSIYKKD